MPSALILSVTRSEHLARSSPVASESRRTGSRLAIDVFTSHPARLIYPRASAHSSAVLLVAFPISRAACLKASYSSPVAPAMADVFAIACSKPWYVSTASEINSPSFKAPQAAAAVAAAAWAMLPRLLIFCPASPIALSKEEETAPAIFMASLYSLLPVALAIFLHRL